MSITPTSTTAWSARPMRSIASRIIIGDRRSSPACAGIRGWNPWVEWSWHLPLPSVLGSAADLVPADGLRSLPGVGLLGNARLDAAAGRGMRHVGRFAAGRAARPNGPAIGGGAVRRSRPSRGEAGAALSRMVPQQRQSPIMQPFNVMLFAGNDDRLAADLPQAGVRVTAMEANDVQSVDIRLPMEVYTMGRDAQGKPAPFSILHVLVDANREIRKSTRNNNGARLIPAEILPVDPAAFEVDPVAAKPGREVLLAGEGLGPEPGQVLVHVGGKEMQGEILGWYDFGVRWTLPKLAIPAPTEAEVIVIRGDGAPPTR